MLYIRGKRKLFFNNYNIILFLLILYVSLSNCTLSPTKTKDKKIRDVKRGPLDISVFDRNLISDKPNSKDILRENQAYFENTNVKNFNGSILGYVTPVSNIYLYCNLVDW